MAFVDARGTNLFYESVGEGEPLVLVHGGFLDHTLWMLAVPILAERFRVVTLDQVGHGQSEGSIDPTANVDEAMDVLVEHLAALVEQLDLAPAHFAGQSSGGGTILHLATRRPDLFRSMSLHEPAVVALLDEEFKAARGDQMAASTLLGSGDVDAGLRKFVETVGGDWSQMPEPFKAIFRRNAHNYAGASFFADPALALTVPEGLGELPHPVQFTKGDRSPRFFHVSIDRVAAMFPRAEISTIDGGGHAAMLERPAEYAAALMDFIDRTRVGST